MGLGFSILGLQSFLIQLLGQATGFAVLCVCVQKPINPETP